MNKIFSHSPMVNYSKKFSGNGGMCSFYGLDGQSRLARCLVRAGWSAGRALRAAKLAGIASVIPGGCAPWNHMGKVSSTLCVEWIGREPFFHRISDGSLCVLSNQ